MNPTDLSNAQVYGIGGVAVAAFISMGYLVKAMISVVQKNAESNVRVAEAVTALKENVGGLQKSIEQNTEVTRGTKDLFSSAFVQMLRNNKDT